MRPATGIGRQLREAAVAPGRLSRTLAITACSLLASAATAPPVLPQESASPLAGSQTPRTVTGRVVRFTPDGLHPVAGSWVVLHRVGFDSAGALDSVRTGSAGRYSFRYSESGDPGALYFVSAAYGGISHFSAPLRDADVSGERAEIVVFDTTSGPVPIRIGGRHIVIGAAPVDGMREIIDVYELANDSSLTRVGGAVDSTVWSNLLPPGARDLQVGQADIPGEAVGFSDGRISVFAPISPGLRQLAVSYRVPAGEFPLPIPVESAASLLEVLIEDARGSVSGAGLVEVDPVSVEGRTFRRFLAQDVPAAAVATVQLGEAPRGRRGVVIAVVLLAIGASMLFAMARASGRRVRHGDLPREIPPRSDAAAIRRQMDALDAAFQAQELPSDEARATYSAVRADLEEQLQAALAAGERHR